MNCGSIFHASFFHHWWYYQTKMKPCLTIRTMCTTLYATDLTSQLCRSHSCYESREPFRGEFLPCTRRSRNLAESWSKIRRGTVAHIPTLYSEYSSIRETTKQRLLTVTVKSVCFLYDRLRFFLRNPLESSESNAFVVFVSCGFT